MNQEKLLTYVAATLDELGILYGISGGFAVTVWGRPRFTADIDIVLVLKKDHIEPLASSLQKTGDSAYIDTRSMRTALEHNGSFNFIHPESGLKIDFILAGDEPLNLEELRRRRELDIAGQTVYFLSPEDLIVNKLIWYKKSASTRHLEDIASVVETQEKIDWSYIEKWAREKNVIEELGKITK